MFSLTVTVDPSIERTLKKLQAQLPVELGRAMFEEANAFMRDAVARAPRGDGQLGASAFVMPPADGGVVAGFGAPYAGIVHERTDVHHSRGEAKFLQHAVDQATAGMLERLGKQLGPCLEGKSVSTTTVFPAAPPTGGRSHSRRRRHTVRAALRGRR